MKYLILSLLLLSPTLTRAEDPIYWNPCFGRECPAETQKISEEFMQADGIKEESLPVIFSGSCYHLTPSLNPNIEHFGVVLLDNHEGTNYTGGEYGFFYKENPYRDLDVQKARKTFNDTYTDRHRIKLHENYAYSDMNPGATGPEIVKYWMRQKNNFLYVVGQWGGSHTIVCRMEKNPKQ